MKQLDKKFIATLVLPQLDSKGVSSSSVYKPVLDNLGVSVYSGRHLVGLMGDHDSSNCYNKLSFLVWLIHFVWNPITSSETGTSIRRGLQQHILTQAAKSTVLCGHRGPEMHLARFQ